MNFQDRLYRLRKERGISQEELANAVGVSRQAVQKWESGASAPDVGNLVALSDFFGTTLDYLLKGLEPAPAEPPADGAGQFYPPLRFEYKSRRTLFGLPLVHVNVGRFCMPRARGILAVGNVATGVFSLGFASAGLFSLGGASLGLFSLGGLALGLLAVGGRLRHRRVRYGRGGGGRAHRGGGRGLRLPGHRGRGKGHSYLPGARHPSRGCGRPPGGHRPVLPPPAPLAGQPVLRHGVNSIK